MAKSSSSSENKVYDDSYCSKSCRKNTDNLNTKISKLNEELSDSENNLYHYKIGLPEFVDDTITDYSRPTPSIDSSKSNTSDLQNSNSFVSEHEELSSSIMSKPMIQFVKTADCIGVIKTNKTETARKSPVKYAEMYRNTSKSPKVRGNQRNWNNLKSQQLGKDFMMHNKACYICGSFDHLQYTCKEKRQLNDKREEKPLWNNAGRVNHQNSSKITHPNLKRHMVLRKILTRSGSISLNTARQSHLNVVCYCCSRQVNTARPKAVINAVRTNRVNDVKASACWVWKPIKPNSASITLKRYDYVDVRGRFSTKSKEVVGYILQVKIKLLIKKLEDSEAEHQVYGRIVGIKEHLIQKT
uniref:Retrotransposon Orf1 n=1 Tax=Tanacetum cinerariifolium TaxID=118510 RepID=A0A6L2M7I4_TANCI|nr:retrotransposon Orf1 [Tanacetum cinerariifolium]